MVEETDATNEPTESAFDLVEAVKAQNALSVFVLNISRIHTLLRASLSGIEKEKKQLDSLLRKFQAALDAPMGSNSGSSAEHKDDGGADVEFSEDEIKRITSILGVSKFVVGDIDYYLHNVLCVAAWSAFEGYVQATLAQLFAVRTDLLASTKVYTVKEILGSGDQLINFLVAKEIDDIGRKSFSDLQSYMRSKIKLEFSQKHAERLQTLYFLRNVIAHSAGKLRPDQIDRVPAGIEVQSSELRIGREFLVEAIGSIQEAVLSFEKQLRKRFAL